MSSSSILDVPSKLPKSVIFLAQNIRIGKDLDLSISITRLTFFTSSLLVYSWENKSTSPSS